jgi:cytosine/adenosine deaminase-related metal-dependent hydrolase
MTGVDGGVGVTGLLAGRYINIENDKIVSVSKNPQFKNINDYGNRYDILPGMINAHTHLELSQLESPLQLSQKSPDAKTPAMLDLKSNFGQFERYCGEFDQWIKQLIDFRRSEEYDLSLGLNLARRYFELYYGTVAVVDIVPFGLDLGDVGLGENVEWFCYPELIAWDSISVTKKIDAICGLSISSYLGLSPHAPHTVSSELLEFVVDFGVPVVMHLAESPEEMRLLRYGDGRLLEMMRKVDDNYDPSKVLLGRKPMDYLQVLSRAPKVLVIHGNYLDDGEIKFMAECNETMALVYTPRSHDYFGFDELPLQKMLDSGVCVLVGTDSKASTPDLSMINEINHAASIYKNIPIEIFWQMATINAAKFLGLIKNYGTIESGKKAIFSLYKNNS